MPQVPNATVMKEESKSRRLVAAVSYPAMACRQLLMIIRNGP